MADVERLLKGTAGESDRLLDAKTLLGDPIRRDGVSAFPSDSHGIGLRLGGDAAQKPRASARTGSGAGSNHAARPSLYEKVRGLHPSGVHWRA